jgi:hypothetical protein
MAASDKAPNDNALGEQKGRLRSRSSLRRLTALAKSHGLSDCLAGVVEGSGSPNRCTRLSLTQVICPFGVCDGQRDSRGPICESFGADSSDSSSGDGPHRAFQRDARKFFFRGESGVPETSFAWRGARPACYQEATQLPSYQIDASQKRPFDRAFLQFKDYLR